MQQQSQNRKLPLGCRFVPKDRELITYLSNKAKGLPDIGEGFITVGIDVYGTSLNDLRANGGHKKKYYFTPAKFKKSSSRCRDRRTPDGHWKSNDKKHEVFDKEGKMVGFVRDLTHMGGTNDGRTPQNWKMKEYTLPESDSSDHVALCVIYSPRDNTKKPDKNANSSQMLVQNQSTSPNNAFHGLPPAPAPAPADGITTGYPNGDIFNGLPSLEPGSGLLGSPASAKPRATAPANGITTGYPNGDIFNGLPSLEPGSGLLGSPAPALARPRAPADGITTGCPNDDDDDDDVFNGLPPLELGSGLLGSSSDDDSFLASLMSDVGWQESLWLRNEQDSFLATFPSSSGLPESSFVDNEAASISETPLLEEFWNYR